MTGLTIPTVRDRTPVLRVANLRTYFLTERGVGRAVDGVSFELFEGETLGLVGESGCGKSITALSIMGLLPKPFARNVGGSVHLLDRDLIKMRESELRQLRGKQIAMVLQDPMTALNPVLNIGDQIGESLRLHQGLRGGKLRERAVELLGLLRIPSPAKRLKDYPHQFSGGMRQRVVGAIALSCNPAVLIADEPTTALDVTIQAGYLALLKELQQKTNLTILFITHDLGVVSKMCDRVAVMYAGRIVESAPTVELFVRPAHPYTAALLNSVPDLREGKRRLQSIEGNPPSMYRERHGCDYYDRCALRKRLGNPERCRVEAPELREVWPSRRAACHYSDHVGTAERRAANREDALC